jgi:hypothetical protein
MATLDIADLRDADLPMEGSLREPHSGFKSATPEELVNCLQEHAELFLSTAR